MTIRNRTGSSGRRERFLLLAIFGAAVISLANVIGFAAKTHTSAAATAGSAIFHKNCIVCHNKQPGDTTPFGPPNLHGVFKTTDLTSAQAQEIITNGKGQMPAWGKTLTPKDIKNVIAYLKTY